MNTEVGFECRVQCKRSDGEWFTIDEAGEAALVLEGDIVDLLARWVSWFEARGFTEGGVIRGLCQCCLMDVSEQGHASDCQYGMSKALLGANREGEE